MKTLNKTLLLLTMSVLGSGLAQAQSTSPTMVAAAEGLTRAQVKMDRDEFLRTHTWNEASDIWTLKSGIEPPTGVKSRAEVRTARDEFLRTNRWDELNGTWQPLKIAPKGSSEKTRAQVRAETIRFAKTHRWDEATETWTVRTPATVRP